VHGGDVECPYHGWRFDAAGHCTRVPGIDCDTGTQPLVHAVATRESHGLVWGCLAPDAQTPEPLAPTEAPNPIDSFFMTGHVRCTITDAAENFLDGFHTHFVHAGWVRSDRQRQTVRVRVRSWADGVEAIYSGEGRQAGLVSRWFERDRSESMGRFRAPGVAEIEYRGRKGLTLLVTAWFTPATDGELRLHARIATARGLLPAWLKRLVLRRVFGVILRQDQAMLEQVSAHATHFGPAVPPEWLRKPLDGPQDFLGPSIRRLMNGDALPEATGEPRDVRL
jgi:phenylpropionate dioxygenase-like ring-hydroxylating dioxygenase large terminal subunit